ncbi:SMI1/KNR4 family protein [Planctomycetota bacterium]
MKFLKWLQNLVKTEPSVTYPMPHVRPYVPVDRSAPFVAEREPREIEVALESLEGIFSWDGYSERPGQRLFAGDSLDGIEQSAGLLDDVEIKPLTDELVADAENAVRLKLPASYLAILRMQNGGRQRNLRRECGVLDFCGIAPGHGSQFPIQEMPRYMWEAFEGYIDDEFYDQWRDTLDYVHPDWGEKPRLPEAVLFVAPDVHDGIALNYIKCGRQGEPSVVHVEMEDPPPRQVLTELAPDFVAFLKMLYRG